MNGSLVFHFFSMYPGPSPLEAGLRSRIEWEMSREWSVLSFVCVDDYVLLSVNTTWTRFEDES
jgi:hypothetical protein